MQKDNPITVERIGELAKNLVKTYNVKKVTIQSFKETINLAKVVLDKVENLRCLTENAEKQLKEELKGLKAHKKAINEILGLMDDSSKELNTGRSIALFAEGNSIADSGDAISAEDATNTLKEEMLTLFDLLQKTLIDKIIPKKTNGSHSQPPIKTQKPVIGVITDKNKSELPGEDKPFSIERIKSEFTDVKKCAAKLLSMDKKCEICFSFNKDVLILGSNCALCISCIKNTVMKNENLLKDTFGAHEEKEETVCVCPSHNSPISPQILLGLFGEKVVEEASIAALKNQLNNKRYGRCHPVICAECKTLVKKGTDIKEATPVCARHRLCTKCYKKSEGKLSKQICKYCEEIRNKY